MDEKTRNALDLLSSHFTGILGTNSVEIPGYPFGSLTPYCLDREGCPVILISGIAQHTKNIMVTPKVSLTIVENLNSPQSQNQGRVTWIGDAVKTEDEETIATYSRMFPQSASYHKTHDFFFYRIEPIRVRFIKGFGQIYWLEKNDVINAPALTVEESAKAVAHMNKDHEDAMIGYMDHYYNDIKYKDLTMIGVDSLGFYLRADERPLRFSFPEVISTSDELRKALVQMIKAIRASKTTEE